MSVRNFPPLLGATPASSLEDRVADIVSGLLFDAAGRVGFDGSELAVPTREVAGDSEDLQGNLVVSSNGVLRFFHNGAWLNASGRVEEVSASETVPLDAAGRVGLTTGGVVTLTLDTIANYGNGKMLAFQRDGTSNLVITRGGSDLLWTDGTTATSWTITTNGGFVAIWGVDSTWRRLGERGTIT